MWIIQSARRGGAYTLRAVTEREERHKNVQPRKRAELQLYLCR